MKRALASIALMLLSPVALAARVDLPNLLHRTRPCEYVAKDGGVFRYRFVEPAQRDAGAVYPLVILMHGAGERGTNNVDQLVHGARYLLDYLDRTEKNYFFLAGQVPEGKRWVETDWNALAHQMPEQPSETMARQLEFLESFFASNPVDRRRVYVTGLSMGGYGTWDILSRRPEWFAAAMPICGGADLAQAEKMREVPIWAYHGDRDTIVPFVRSRKMAAALWACNGKIKYTEFPGVAHNAWDPAYGNDANLKWFFSQRKEELPFTWKQNACAPLPDPIGAGEIIVKPPRCVEGVVSAAEFGLSPTNDFNGAAIERALAEAKRRGAHRLELAPGRYNCFDARGIFIEGFEDFEIDGKGAELNFRRAPHLPMNPSWDHDLTLANIVVRNCRRIRLGNFDMDWDWRTMPLATAAKVVSRHIDEADDQGSYVVFELLGHGSRHALYGQTFPVQRVQPMASDLTRFLKGNQWWFGTYEGDVGAKAEWIDGTHVKVYPFVRDESKPWWSGPNSRIFKRAENRAACAKGFAEGEIVRIAHAYYGKGGCALDSNEDLELHDVNIYACFGHGLYIDGSQRNWMAKNVSFAPRDLSHPISSTADSVHFVRSEGKAIFDNLTVKLNSDDAINVHDRFTVVKPSGACAAKVILERGTRYFLPKVGHEVELRNPDYSPTGWKARVVALKRGGDDVVFDRELPAPAKDYFLLFDRTSSSDGVIVRNCTFEDIEMRVLFNCSNVTVEDSKFIRTNCDAIRVLADYTLTYWAEGMGATNIVIRNCAFDSNCAREVAGASWSSGADFSIWLGAPSALKPTELYRPFISNILVENCVFRDSFGYFADLRAGENIVFRGNLVENTSRRASCRANSGCAYLENVKNVRFEDTRFLGCGAEDRYLKLGDGVEGLTIK